MIITDRIPRRRGGHRIHRKRNGTTDRNVSIPLHFMIHPDMVDMVIGVTVFIQRACKPTAVNYRFTNQPIWLGPPENPLRGRSIKKSSLSGLFLGPCYPDYRNYPGFGNFIRIKRTTLTKFRKK